MFLVDTGADISLLPVVHKIRGEPTSFKLFAANDTRINTYGESFRSLDLGLRRPLRWNFTIADVPYAIIGADLLSYFGLSVDLRKRVLVDSLTGLQVHASIKRVEFTSTNTIDHASTYSGLLLQFPEITGNSRVAPPTGGDVYHYIDTTGPPVSERPRRLSPDKLKAAKAEFKRLVEAGICRPSSSPWSSPIHMIMKADGTWRIAGEYHRTNTITVPDRYPTPHLHESVG